MKILVINAGSSSLKYQLIDMQDESVLAKGNCERIGVDGLITHSAGDKKIEKNMPFPTHKEAFMAVVEMLTSGEGKVIDNVQEISAVGHRVLHGSEKYKVSTVVTDQVIDDILSFKELGPLHNPPQAIAMRACQEVFGKEMPMVAVFDTSFHQSMPRKAYMFGIPYEYYEKYSIRRYGFHGTSHRYVTARYGKIKGGLEGSKIITCHLGNGSSIAAVKDGKVVDTTMGFTPLDGFIMGTRSGGVDPSVVTYLMNKEGFTPDEMSDLLNKKSGFLGLSGVSSDCRDLRQAADSGNDRAKMTLEIVVYQIKKFIGSYIAAMNGVDAVIFTGGIGENDDVFRAEVCREMEALGLCFDEEKNKAASRKDAKFSADGSRVEAWVIPTNEELMIARDTLELIGK
ncbi:acetate/propionate family kinase [Bittarella massiliensis (ex Durand et al. 2017)]|uniref:acetate/propionate family kinase n=1 Tax=Bittarella massiliensis (ex Durand et al. 2017) TaxID=1720313 RepID=UPI001AA1C26D|nr:acetate kinase [Bittarella massiliensis (ex Durand et al. 2017)]MBO1679974.1 acetate kinase [Bittarella massiliensis (ex Durand et al. 2017)]